MKKNNEFPFPSYAWDDNPSNNHRWCDAEQAESAYTEVVNRNIELTRVLKDVLCVLEEKKDYPVVQQSIRCAIDTTHKVQNSSLNDYPVLKVIRTLLETHQPITVAKLSRLTNLKQKAILDILLANKTCIEYGKCGKIRFCSPISSSKKEAFKSNRAYRASTSNYGSDNVLEVNDIELLRANGLITSTWYGGYGDSYKAERIEDTPENRSKLEQLGYCNIESINYGHPLFLWKE